MNIADIVLDGDALKESIEKRMDNPNVNTKALYRNLPLLSVNSKIRNNYINPKPRLEVPAINLTFFLSVLVNYESVFPSNTSNDRWYWATNEQMEVVVWEALQMQKPEYMQNWFAWLKRRNKEGVELPPTEIKIWNQIENNEIISYQQLKEIDYYHWDFALYPRVRYIRERATRKLAESGKIIHEPFVAGDRNKIIRVHELYLK